MHDREKLRLISAFSWGVSAYVIASVAVIVLPAFVPSVVDFVIVLLQNAVLWVFVAALLVVFRMREGNQYLNLVEADGDTGAWRGDVGGGVGLVVAWAVQCLHPRTCAHTCAPAHMHTRTQTFVRLSLCMRSAGGCGDHDH